MDAGPSGFKAWRQRHPPLYLQLYSASTCAATSNRFPGCATAARSALPAAVRVYLCTVPCDMGRGCDGLGRIAGHPVIQLDELLPANWKPATTWAPFQIQPACTRVKRDHLCARDAYVVSSSSAPAASACQPRSGGGSARLTERFYSLLERNAPSWLWTLFYLPTQFQQYRSQWLVRGDKDPAVFRAFA